MALTAQEVWRDYVTDNVPSSGNWDPKKSEIRTLLYQYEQIISAFTSNGGLIYSSKSSLDGDLAHDANSMAWVVGDATAANNGVYMKVGSSGFGSWTRVADLPYSFIVALDVGAGTPDAIQATSLLPVSSSSLVLLNVADTNTGSPVTISFNGGSALTVKSNTGNNIAAGGLQSNMLVMGCVSGSTFRIVTDQVSSAIIAQAEAWAQHAEQEADRAEDAFSAVSGIATTIIDPQFPTRTAAMSFSPAIAPEFIRTSGYAAVGDNGGALYKKVAVEPAHVGKLSLTLSDGVTVAWYEIAETHIDPVMLGADPSGVSDAKTQLLDAEAVAKAVGAAVRYTRVHRISSNAEFTKGVWFVDGASIIVPAGVVIAFSDGIIAGDYKIFQYTDRTCRVYVRNDEVRGYWWGCSMEYDPPTQTYAVYNNEVFLQYALDSVAGYGFGDDDTIPVYSWNGGTIRLPAGVYKMRGGVVMHSFTTIRGQSRRTIFEPDVDNWTPGINYMFWMYRKNKAGDPVSQFNVRLENCRIHGLGFNQIQYQVLAQSAQEQCGCYNVHFDKIYQHGLYFSQGFGGAAIMEVRQCEFWLDTNCTIGAACLYVDASHFTLGWMSFVVSHVTFAGAAVPTTQEWSGLRATGRVVCEVNGIHGEQLRHVALLSSGASMTGGSIKGGVNTTNVITVVADWSGKIDVSARLGNAVRLYADAANPANNITTDVAFMRLQK